MCILSTNHVLSHLESFILLIYNRKIILINPRKNIRSCSSCKPSVKITEPNLVFDSTNTILLHLCRCGNISIGIGWPFSSSKTSNQSTCYRFIWKRYFMIYIFCDIYFPNRTYNNKNIHVKICFEMLSNIGS